MRRELATHLRVFWLILIVVAANVATSFLPLDRGVKTTVQVGLAVLAAGLVLTFYMHLISETLSTYLVMGLTGFLLVAMLGLILVARESVPDGTHSTVERTSATQNPAANVP